MQKMTIISKELTNLQQIQNSIYQSIHQRQKQLLKQLQLQQKKTNHQINRQKNIKQQNLQQHIAHPYNQDIWIRLGNCIHDYQTNSLDDVRLRQIQRAQERKQIQEEKRLKITENQTQNSNYESNNFEIQKKGAFKSKKQTQQIPWKLMRKLRQHDVEQNIKIIQKQQNQKLSRINKKHK